MAAERHKHINDKVWDFQLDRRREFFRRVRRLAANETKVYPTHSKHLPWPSNDRLGHVDLCGCDFQSFGTTSVLLDCDALKSNECHG